MALTNVVQLLCYDIGSKVFEPPAVVNVRRIFMIWRKICVSTKKWGRCKASVFIGGEVKFVDPLKTNRSESAARNRILLGSISIQ